MRNCWIALALALSLMMGGAASGNDTFVTAMGQTVRTLDMFQDCDVCPEMIVLPLGEFQMGSSIQEANAAQLLFYLNMNSDPSARQLKLRQALIKLGIDPDQPAEGLLEYYSRGNIVRQEDPQYSGNGFLHEAPRHHVSIDLPIAMARNEVTRQEWTACVEDGGCERGHRDLPRSEYISCEEDVNCVPSPDTRVRFRLPHGPHAAHPRSPMTGMTYHEMNDYTSWLNQTTGAPVYRVPTEAEWEYAARSGTTTRFAQGDTLTLEQANFLVSRRETVEGELVWNYDLGSAGELLPVDELDAANSWGLRHMSGNAAELTSTCGEGPHRGFASSSAYLLADAGRATCKRSVKGGTFNYNVEMARPARRVPVSSDHWSHSIGFRVVRDLAVEQ